jgi:hypothetical protein
MAEPQGKPRLADFRASGQHMQPCREKAADNKLGRVYFKGQQGFSVYDG